MNILDQFKKIYNSFTNIPNIPQDLKDIKEPKVLHISDTPVSYHSFIYKVIEELMPDYLIHTGDLVDNLKMEFNHQLKDAYEVRAASFIKQLESLPLKKIFIIPGNHDDLQILKDYCKRIIILEEGMNLTLENIIINVAHHPRNLGNNAHYYLYGHNFQSIPKIQDQVFLNGLNKMHVILLSTNKVIPIDYPYGINQDRKMYSNTTKGGM
jgi:predicted MPP superfamily phosphohydrolase